MPALEISELFSLMEELPGTPPPDSPSLLESPSSPHSTTTEDLSVFGGAGFESSYMDMDLPSADEDAGPGAPLIISLTSPHGPASRRNARKRAADDEAPSVDLTAEDEARKAQRMARNRRAAATSRARKKEQLELLQGQVDKLQDENEELQDENTELRRRLRDAGLMSDELDGQRGRRPYGPQPAALCWTYSPQLEFPLPTPPLAIMLVLALLRVHRQASLWMAMSATTSPSLLLPRRDGATTAPSLLRPAATLPLRCGGAASRVPSAQTRPLWCACTS